ncbi:unnamed protein product [Amoebophrya sp. A120]|nr:unnamed protein product [Amoebophrya sp. A120]|eukprot:GSA120T00004956001.1
MAGRAADGRDSTRSPVAVPPQNGNADDGEERTSSVPPSQLGGGPRAGGRVHELPSAFQVAATDSRRSR